MFSGLAASDKGHNHTHTQTHENKEKDVEMTPPSPPSGANLELCAWILCFSSLPPFLLICPQQEDEITVFLSSLEALRSL